jgi:putative membrane protein
MRFILQAVFAAVGLWLASRLLHGVHVDSTGSLIAAAVLLGLANALVRPIAVFFTLPVTLITFGLFLLVINGLMVWLVAALLSGFSVRSLWAAILTSVIVSLTSWVGAHLIPKQRR